MNNSFNHRLRYLPADERGPAARPLSRRGPFDAPEHDKFHTSTEDEFLNDHQSFGFAKNRGENKNEETIRTKSASSNSNNGNQSKKGMTFSGSFGSNRLLMRTIRQDRVTTTSQQGYFILINCSLYYCIINVTYC